jgi:hypothetical protein
LLEPKVLFHADRMFPALTVDVTKEEIHTQASHSSFSRSYRSSRSRSLGQQHAFLSLVDCRLAFLSLSSPDIRQLNQKRLLSSLTGLGRILILPSRFFSPLDMIKDCRTNHDSSSSNRSTHLR